MVSFTPAINWTLEDGDKLRQRRINAKLSRVQLAGAADMTPEGITLLENAMRAPFRDEMPRIERALRDAEKTR